MQKTTISLNSNTEIPSLGLGTWQLEEHTYDAVKAALELGYRHIDTAMIYNNEEDVGRAIADSGIAREELFITTKLWNADQDNVDQAFRLSLEKLGLEYVDLYLMHWPVIGRVKAYKKMEGFVKDGRAKAIGVSNFTVNHLEAFLQNVSIVPAVNQVEFNPFLNQIDLARYCESKGIVLEAYSPITHAHKLNDDKLTSIAGKYSKTPAQLLLRWGVQQGMVVIPKSKNPERLAQNFAIFDFTIADDDMQAMNSWNENARFCGDPTEMP